MANIPSATSRSVDVQRPVDASPAPSGVAATRFPFTAAPYTTVRELPSGSPDAWPVRSSRELDHANQRLTKAQAEASDRESVAPSVDGHECLAKADLRSRDAVLVQDAACHHPARQAEGVEGSRRYAPFR